LFNPTKPDARTRFKDRWGGGGRSSGRKGGKGCLADEGARGVISTM